MLNSFDTLASHLYTTFIALSTALALRGSPEKPASGIDALHRHQKHGLARVFFAVALGSTVGTAKSRVIVGIDGLEIKVWGLEEDATQTGNGCDEKEEDDLADDASDTDDEGEQSGVEESGGSSEEEEGGEDIYGSDDAASPPHSRSPSPSSDLDASPSTSPQNSPSKSPLLQIEDPETVRAAERLLSRTLASACAEDDGRGLASEMGKPKPYSCRRVAHLLLAPTQIHVLLRAPRRFDHPCWIPRQNLCASLDGCLSDFLVESGETPPFSDAPAKKRTKGNKVQGVWVKARGGSTPNDLSSGGDLAEEDEFIWWSWDGKLAGFADW